VNEVSAHKSPLLTKAEAIAWLRLNEPGGPKNPECTLRRYRELGLLRCTRVGRQGRYHIDDLRDLVDHLRERTRS